MTILLLGMQVFRQKRYGLGAAALTLLACGSASAGPLQALSVGAGLRTSFASTEFDGVDETVTDAVINSMRLYFNGAVDDTIKFTVNTEFTQDVDNDLQLLDAIARFEFSPKFNIWAGRFLPPSDRANLYGPYYANNWGVYIDGVQDGYPFIAVGRDNGVAYWGDFGRAKFSLGAFDVGSTLGTEDVLIASRFQIDLWDLEPGYYLNGTYYGEKDIFALGLAGQSIGGDSGITADLLIEKKVGAGGAATLEAEYASFDGVGGYNTAGLPFDTSDGYYVLGAYLFPTVIGPGKFQVLGKFGSVDYDAVTDFTQTTTELELNYIIKGFDARTGLFYIGTDYDDAAPTVSQFGISLQIQI